MQEVHRGFQELNHRLMIRHLGIREELDREKVKKLLRSVNAILVRLVL